CQRYDQTRQYDQTTSARPIVGPSQDDLRQPFQAHPRLTGCSMRKNIMPGKRIIQFPVAMCQYVSGSTKNRRFNAKMATENINTQKSNAAASVGITKSSFFIGSSPFLGCVHSRKASVWALFSDNIGRSAHRTRISRS